MRRSVAFLVLAAFLLLLAPGLLWFAVMILSLIFSSNSSIGSIIGTAFYY